MPRAGRLAGRHHALPRAGSQAADDAEHRRSEDWRTIRTPSSRSPPI